MVFQPLAELVESRDNIVAQRGAGMKVPEIMTSNAILGALHRLKSWPGWIPDSELWTWTLDRHLGNSSVVRGWVEQDKLRIQNLDRVVNALQEMQESATRLKEKLHSDMIERSLHTGLSRLPDELLLQIVTLTRADDRRSVQNVDILQMAAVCRRFRDIIFSNAKFWSSVDNFFNPKSVDIALERSKQARLAMQVFNIDYWFVKSSMSFLEKMRPHYHRISSLTLTFADVHNQRYDSWESIHDVMTTLAKCDFPCLESYTMHAPPLYQDDEQNEGDPPLKCDDDMYHVYTKWNAPSLKQLHLIELVPRAHAKLVLTSVDIDIESDWHWKSAEYPMIHLLRFLQSQPSLEIVKIAIDYPAEDDDLQWEETIHFPVLHTLDFTMTTEFSAVDSASYIPSFFSCLSMPVVEHMNILFSIDDSNFTMESLFPKHREYPQLKRLALQLYQEDEIELTVAPFKTIFTKFPTLTYARILLAGFTVIGDVPDPSAHPPPPLEELLIQETTKLSLDALKQVLEYIGGGPHADQLKKICIDDCSQITNANIDELAKIIPRSRIYI